MKRGWGRVDRQKKRCKDNIKEWTGMDFASSDGTAETEYGGKGLFQVICISLMALQVLVIEKRH